MSVERETQDVQGSVRKDGAVPFVRFEVNASGNFILHTNIETLGTARDAPKDGRRMPDDTVFAGISPDTLQAMYTTLEDSPGTAEHPDSYTLAEAQEYIEKCNAQKYLGHDDWRWPTKGELKVLFDNRAAIGNLRMPEEDPDLTSYYWAAGQEISRDGEWIRRFNDENCSFNVVKGKYASLRCVR